MIYLINTDGQHSEGEYHNEYCGHETHTWEFRSDVCPEWTGTIQRLALQSYKLTTNDKPILSYELDSFAYKFHTISDGGRK